MNQLVQMDGNILIWIQEHIRQEWLNPIVEFITNLGDNGLIWIVLLVMMLFFKKYRNTGWTGLIALLIGFLITNVLLKNLVARTRPFVTFQELTFLGNMPHDWSFPSGHSTSSIAVSFVMFLKLPKKAGILALILGICITLSRLYVGVHYPTDVICGTLIGIFAAWAADKIADKIAAKKTDK